MNYRQSPTVFTKNEGGRVGFLAPESGPAQGQSSFYAGGTMSLEKLAALLMTVLFTALPTAAPAADYPTKPVRMIVGWAAGGGADLMIRLVEKEFEQEFGQPFTKPAQTEPLRPWT